MSDFRAHPNCAAPDARRGQEGSAYLFVLLILLVLTVIALALGVITQTEVQIGGAQKSATRTFYGSDSGARLQLAYAKTKGTAPKARYFLDENDVAGVTMEERMDVSPFLPMFQGPCALCTVNVGSENRKWAVNFVVNSDSRRVGISGTDEIPQSARLISMMFFVQPEGAPPVDEGLRQFDPEDLTDDPAFDGLDVIRY